MPASLCPQQRGRLAVLALTVVAVVVTDERRTVDTVVARVQLELGGPNVVPAWQECQRGAGPAVGVRGINRAISGAVKSRKTQV